jgi:serine/threonine-protein kinase
MILLGSLAWRNFTAGRGDRRGARRLAVVMFGVYFFCGVGYRHWPGDPALLMPVIMALFALPGFFAMAVWLLYLGIEPAVRRRWPQLLVGWTRLLDGRWRDPLVGRAVLSGIVYGLVILVLVTTPLIVARWLDWIHMGPDYKPFVLNPGGFWAANVADGAAQGIVNTLLTVATLVIARWLLRSNAAALAGWALVLVVIVTWTFVNWGTPFAVALSVAVLVAAIQVIVLMRAGMLGCAAAFVTAIPLDLGVPWTLDPSRWYFYRSALVALVVVGLAFWAFKIALGRQSMFPAEE